MREINHICPVCETATMDDYMVTDECWKEAGFTYYQNVHLHCLAEVLECLIPLGRRLVLADFPDVPVNINMPQVLKCVVGLPQGFNAWMKRREEIVKEYQRRKA